jgi:uncharacterized membrane protein YcaP (DUF421 family)
MFELEAAWWTFLLRTAVVYLGLLVGLRLFGRRELGQMTPFDLVVILLIANTLQNAMVGPDTSVTGGLLAAFTLLTINWLLSIAEVRVPWLRHAAEGEPILLVSEGQLLTRRLRRERISVEALGQAAREHGVPDLSAVDAAILEIDGTVSIIPKRGDTIRTRHHVRKVSRLR